MANQQILYMTYTLYNETGIWKKKRFLHSNLFHQLTSSF